MKRIKLNEDLTQEGITLLKDTVLEYTNKLEEGYLCITDTGRFIIPKDSATELHPFYFTFGQKYDKLKNAYCLVWAESGAKAVKIANQKLNDHWSCYYWEDEWFHKKGSPGWKAALYHNLIDYNDEREYISQADIYRLKEVTLDYAKEKLK